MVKKFKLFNYGVEQCISGGTALPAGLETGVYGGIALVNAKHTPPENNLLPS